MAGVLLGIFEGWRYTAAVEEYFADQFPLRDAWTGLKARTEQLIGKTEFHGVYLCGDTLISKVDAPDEELVTNNLSYITPAGGKNGRACLSGVHPLRGGGVAG